MGLASLVFEHGGAIDYDLMTRTRFTLRDLESGALDWRTLMNFVRHLPPQSALYVEMHPEHEMLAKWTGGEMTPFILADLFDSLAMFRAEHAAKGSGRTPKKTKRYKRPVEDREVKRIGKGAVPASQIKNWYYNKRSADG